VSDSFPIEGQLDFQDETMQSDQEGIVIQA